MNSESVSCKLRVCCRWQILDQSECSSRCGEGYIVRRIKCIKRSQSGTEYVDDKHCAAVGPRPEERVPCRGLCLSTHWAYTEWSEVGARRVTTAKENDGTRTVRMKRTKCLCLLQRH